MIVYETAIVTYDYSEGDSYFSKLESAEECLKKLALQHVKTENAGNELLKRELGMEFDSHLYMYQAIIYRHYVDENKESEVVFRMDLPEYLKKLEEKGK